MWLVHRQKTKIFNKVGLIITTAGESGVKYTVKLVKNNMFYWAIPTIYDYDVTTMRMGGNYEEYDKKEKIKLQVKKKVKSIKKSLNIRKADNQNFTKIVIKLHNNPTEQTVMKVANELDYNESQLLVM